MGNITKQTSLLVNINKTFFRAGRAVRTILCAITLLLMSGVGITAQTLTLSHTHGFYDQPFDLSITAEGLTTAEGLGGTIRYTTDGSLPTAESRPYTGPVTISGTTVFRAAVVGTNGLLSDVTTATYLFLDDVLKQSDTPEGYTLQWGAFSTISGTAPADYGMDQEMTSDPTLAEKIKEGLQSIPVLSIVTDKENLFSHVNDSVKGGIYIFTGPPVGDNTGNGWTRPVSAELFGCGHDFSVDCGLRLHGGHGRLAEKNPKHSLRLVFKKEYGKKTLSYPLFGDGEPDKFNQLVLRCHFGNSWQHWAENNRQKAQYTRDVWARRMQRKMGRTSVNALYVHVFLNGMYWGLYNIAERVDDQYGKDHLGGKKEDIDVVKVEEEGGNHIEAGEGDLDAWNTMTEVAAKAADDTYYNMLQGKDADGNDDPEQEALLDIDAFIDYMLINQYGGNTDWDHHNWYAIRKKGADSQGFRFLCWDSELILEANQENVLRKNNGDQTPTGIFNHLMDNKQFAVRYMKRAKELLADDGLLGPAGAEEVWDSLYNNISTAIYAEAARWGDYRRDVHPWQTKGSLYTVDDTYMTERNRLHTNYFPSRSSYILSAIESTFGVDDFEPLDNWVPLTASFFHQWDGTGKDATPLDKYVSVDWNVGTVASSGTAIAGFVGVYYDHFADLSDYDKIIIRGKGNSLRLLANRLVNNGEWKEISVSFAESNQYWDDDLKCIVLPLDDLKTKRTSSNNQRIDDFLHLNAIKVGWGSSLTVYGIWLEPKPVKGDVNGDGVVNISDVNAVITVMCGGPENPKADVNGDGVVNVSDVNAVIAIMCGGE